MINWLIKIYESNKEIFAIIGVFAALFEILNFLFTHIPTLKKWKNNLIKSLSASIMSKRLEKLAIANNIEDTINDSVKNLRKELPNEWAYNVKIEWVNGENESDLVDNTIIMRIKPIDNQDTNLMNGIYYFFQKALFPNLETVIPKIPRQASVLHLSRRVIQNQHPYIANAFNSKYLEPAIANEVEIADYIDGFEKIDKKGFFTSVFIREIKNLSENVRFTQARKNIESEIKNILLHIVDFNSALDSIEPIPDELWKKSGEEYSYALILVARPFNYNPLPYVRRAAKYIQENIERLYIIGANQEKRFVKKVIKNIEIKTQYHLVDIFSVNKDYRGENDGICAIFDSLSVTIEGENKVDNFFDGQKKSE